MKVYVLICPKTGKYLKNTMARYSDKYELTSNKDEAFSNESHHTLVALKKSNEAIAHLKLGIREVEEPIDEAKKKFLISTAFGGRGRLGIHKRRLISKGR